MSEKVLVPMDGSDAAEIVFPYVEEIAVSLGFQITLLNVLEPKFADTMHLHKAYLERIAEQLKLHFNCSAVNEAIVISKVIQGKPAQEIVHYADTNNIDLIIMASYGLSGRKPGLLGNIATKVLWATNKPLLLVRSKPEMSASQEKRLLKKILLPLDSSTAGEAAIPWIEAFSKALDAEIVLFQVLEPLGPRADFDSFVPVVMAQDEESVKASAIAYLEKVSKRLKDKVNTISTVVVWGSAAEQITEYSERNSIDLIAMSSHGSAGFGRWVFGSVTEKILHTGQVPILVIRSSSK